LQPRTSGYSYPRVAAIRIDVHPAGKNPTNTTRTLPTPVHIRPTYASCGRSPYVTTFHESPTGLDGYYYSREKCSRLHLSARLSGPWDPLSISLKTAIEAVGLSQAPVDDRLLGLPGPYHRHVISTFNTCSQVPTPTSLTDTGRGYHIKSLRIATTLSPPFPSEGSTDPPKWPRPVSIFIQH
jgi:hypothetical protein